MRLCIGLLALAFLFVGGAYGIVKDDSPTTDLRPSSEDAEDNDIEWLEQISHIVRQESFIDITLPIESFLVNCYVRLPNNTYTTANNNNKLIMEGVQVQSESNFVSCRITIGPMIENLLGTWELCGECTTTKITRCQRVTITFDGASIDPPEIQMRHIHPVHFGGSVYSGVSGNYEVLNCHVVTPAGEDLVLTADVEYPHIEMTISAYNPTLCSVNIMDIRREMLGDWMIYGTFDYPDGAKEIGLPLTFKLYNERSPYEQAYNVTNLEPEEYLVRVGTNLTIEVNQKVGSVEDCIYISNSGQTFSIKSQNSGVPYGVLFNSADTEAACEISFSPIVENVIGEWQIIGKFRNGILFDERRLKFSVNKEEKWLSQINHFTMQRTFIDISLSKESFEEECYIRPPNGFLVRADLVTIPGVKVQKMSNYVSCRVTIGPITGDLLGLWRLCGKSIATSESRCQPANIAWDRDGSRIWDITNRTTFTHPVHFGGSVNSGVASTTTTVESCHVITPAGEDLVITMDTTYPHIERSTITDTALCSVLFTNITRDMLGNWLIYGRFRSILFGQTEVRLPLIFDLYNEENPYEQAYNTTELQSEDHLVHVGTDLRVEITQRPGATEDCIYRSPSGQIFSLKNDAGLPEGVYFNSSYSQQQQQAFCEIIFRPITETSVGEWQMTARFRNGVLFDERRLKFTIIQEDPENPIQDPIQREIQNLTDRLIVTDMNTQHRISINRSNPIIENESCHLIAPDGRQYAFIDGFNVPNVEIIHDNLVDCGIILSVKDESMIGNWIILGRGKRFTDPIERRLHFTIRVEENFVLQNDIHIREGADLYLHLNDAISVPETCMLFGPDGEEFTNVETDPIHRSACGYIIRNVNNSHNGLWVVEYGDKIKIRGHVNVEVIDSDDLSIDNLQWNVGDSINISVGPKDVVYCVIQDPYGHKLFDNFGQCKIVLERVTIDHMGTWTAHIGKPGTVRLQRYDFYVDVHTRDGLPLVTISVEENLPSIMLTCSVPIQHEVHACKFRDPRGNTLIAAHGVGQDGYMFNGSLINYESDAHSHDCTLRLINPSVSDMGIWRCGLDTSTGTYYGFLIVLSHHLMQDPEAAAVVATPLLKDTSLSYVEGDPVTLSCSIPSALRYCYFRAQNGTTFNVFPRMSSTENFEYVGAGLDAGECGIRFKRFLVSEAGDWTCHVGLVNTTLPEQQAHVFADVRAKMSVYHYRIGNEAVVVEANVYNEHALDYCRFVRTDGFGFISDNVPKRYEMKPTLHRGLCTLHISDPDIMDLHPWTIIVKLTAGDGEISMTTTDNLLLSPVESNVVAVTFFWLMTVCLCLIPVVALIILLIPKKNREWTSRKASSMRRSFRNSWSKAFAKKTMGQDTAPVA